MKKTVEIIGLSILFVCAPAVYSTSKSELAQAKQVCVAAPSARKASACYKYNKLKSESGSSTSAAQTLKEAKQKCMSAPWSRKAQACYKYKKMKAEQEAQTLKLK